MLQDPTTRPNLEDKMAQAVPNQMVHILEQLIHRLENIPVGGGATGGGHAVPRDKHGRMEQEARKDYVDFCKLRPQFERGRGRWTVRCTVQQDPE